MANLLEAALFHADAAAALGDSAALELADWACRRLLHLNTAAHAFAAAPGAAHTGSQTLDFWSPGFPAAPGGQAGQRPPARRSRSLVHRRPRLARAARRPKPPPRCKSSLHGLV